jgi:starch-binding outer membrane protein SusE/F
MKKNIHLKNISVLRPGILMLFAVVTLLLNVMISCSDDTNAPGQADLDIGTLSTSTSEVIIDNDKAVDEAITFSWNAERNSVIQNKLVFTAGDRVDTVDVFSNVSVRFTHAEFDKILVNELQLAVGQTASVKAFVYAESTSNGKIKISNEVSITVVPTVPVPVILSANRYAPVIDMAAATSETVTLMWSNETDDAGEYELFLNAGDKTEILDVSADLMKDFSNTELNNILIDKLGLEVGVSSAITASIVVNGSVSNRIEISVTPKDKTIPTPDESNLWIVGSATPNGWNINTPNEMLNDPSNVYQFKYNEVLSAGEFKIPLKTGDWNGGYYMPLVNHQPLSESGVKKIPGGSPDDKWEITAAGAYKIVLNTGANKFATITKFIPFASVYIFGDATTAGWDVDHPLAMTVDDGNPNVMTWTGELTPGRFRFPVGTGSSNKSFFIAPSSGADLETTQLSFTSNGVPGNNFRVMAGDGGTYKITLDQLKETISIEKQ